MASETIAGAGSILKVTVLSLPTKTLARVRYYPSSMAWMGEGKGYGGYGEGRHKPAATPAHKPGKAGQGASQKVGKHLPHHMSRIFRGVEVAAY